ncbi:MAG: hypothetical protein K0S14_1424 [Thermomicrobiales bacterium]|jgi:hypothetical protein|nr:hypothetical protein [Thermomicrobiales bacterium]
MSAQKPAQRPVVHVYVVIDRNDPKPLEPTVIAVGLTRKECRDKITFDPDADNYRIKRARSTLYEK